MAQQRTELAEDVVIDERYRLIKFVGDGGVAVVWEAADARLEDARVALKMLRPEHARSPEHRMRFRQEGPTLAHLPHPNVVRVSDAGTFEGLPYLVMELLQGETLEQYIVRSGRLSVAETRRALLPVISALYAAHSHSPQIIHRDIKPENVMLVPTVEGEVTVKVLDFGVAKTGGGITTQAGMILGTPHYMSPEQANGELVDPRTDIYSVGAMAYQMLTGCPPFEGAGPFEIIEQIRSTSTPPPAFKDRWPLVIVPEIVEATIMRALAKKPEDRFPDMAVLRATVRAWPEKEDPRHGREETLEFVTATLEVPPVARPLERPIELTASRIVESPRLVARRHHNRRTIFGVAFGAALFLLAVRLAFHLFTSEADRDLPFTPPRSGIGAPTDTPAPVSTPKPSRTSRPKERNKGGSR